MATDDEMIPDDEYDYYEEDGECIYCHQKFPMDSFPETLGNNKGVCFECGSKMDKARMGE